MSTSTLNQTRASAPTRPLRPARIALHIFLGIAALIMAVPFLWMMFSSFKPLTEIFQQPPTLIPEMWTTEGYSKALGGADFLRGFWNSTYIAVTSTALALLTSAMAAYAFARIEFRGNKPLFMLFLATMMVPGQLTVIPLYIIMGWIGWIDTHWALIVPGGLFSAFGVFLMRQYIRGIPRELEEAAEIDGANRFVIFLTIILPLLRTPLVALGIFMFLGSWNNFFGPLIFLNSDENFTLPILVNQFKGQFGADWTALMAATTLAAAPLLIVFAVAQRQIVEGIALSGTKA
ncbi:sugar ABC transporter permease [Kocuria polaris]|nr:sugar ABC transporter permease [Kocuria polaris]